MSVHTNTYQYMQYIPNTIHTKTYHANTYQYISQYKPQYILIHTMKSNTCQYTHITSLIREPQGGREREEGRERAREQGSKGGRERGREETSKGAREGGREQQRPQVRGTLDCSWQRFVEIGETYPDSWVENELLFWV